MAKNIPSGRPDREHPLYPTMLKRFREHKGLTAPQLAKKLKVSDSALRKAESGHRAPGVFRALAEVYKEDRGAADVVAAFEANEAFAASPPADEPELLIPSELIRGLAEARITRFFASRAYYKKFRYGRSTISQYVEPSEDSLEMVSISLATGTEIEGIVNTFHRMLSRQHPPHIKISLLDPDQAYLMHSIAPVINTTPKTLTGRIQDTVAAISNLHQRRLSPEQQPRLEIWHHQVLPNASAIIIDGDRDHGTVQLETKGYKTGLDRSFGFEVGAGSEFFETLRDSYRTLIREGRRVL